MADLNDGLFYARREKQERELAEQTSDPSIARIHRGMADHYAGLLRLRATTMEGRSTGSVFAVKSG